MHQHIANKNAAMFQEIAEDESPKKRIKRRKKYSKKKKAAAEVQHREQQDQHPRSRSLLANPPCASLIHPKARFSNAGNVHVLCMCKRNNNFEQ